MKCARCSAEVPGQSQFCLRCGTPLHAAAAPPPVRPVMPTVAPIAAPANNRSLMAVVGVLVVAVLAMAAWMVKSSLAQKPGATSAPSLVQAPAQMSAGPLIQAPAASSTAPVVVAPPAGVQAAPNYSDIDDYLKFVAQVDRTRLSLQSRQMAALLAAQAGSLGQQAEAAQDDEKSKQYLANVNKPNKELAEDWNNLTRQFLARTPPASCVGLHDKYYDFFGKVQANMLKVQDALSQANSGQSSEALSTLTSMMGSASSGIDMAAQRADDALDEICRTYKLEKTFKIQSDSGAAGSLLH